MDGLSDIDALVLLGESELKTMTPEQVKKYFFQKLKERYPKTTIKEGTLAVTVEFPDAEIQLLPAIKYKTGYRIADVSGKEWSFIRPRKFTELLTKVNQDNGNKVVPTIKLAKSIVRICKEPSVNRLPYRSARGADLPRLRWRKNTEGVTYRFFPRSSQSSVKSVAGSHRTI